MVRPKRLYRPNLNFREAVIVRDTGAQYIGHREKGTSLFRLGGAVFTPQELVRGRKRAIQSMHVKGIGKERLQRMFKVK